MEIKGDYSAYTVVATEIAPAKSLPRTATNKATHINQKKEPIPRKTLEDAVKEWDAIEDKSNDSMMKFSLQIIWVGKSSTTITSPTSRIGINSVPKF